MLTVEKVRYDVLYVLHTHTHHVQKHIYEKRLFTVKIPEHNKHSGTYANMHNGPTIRIQATIIKGPG